MSLAPVMEPRLLGKMNERQVLQSLQQHGPMSRAEVSRQLGLSAPTVSKAVAALLVQGLLEETAAPDAARGRPAKKLRLASRNSQVLGVVVDASFCELVTAGLDGRLHDEHTYTFPTPTTYDALLQQVLRGAQQLMSRRNVETLGIGLSLPGLIDYRSQKITLSPNLPCTNEHSLSSDLTATLQLPCVVLQETHALCLAERRYGAARELSDFAMLDLGFGIGLGVVSGGRLLTGHSGLAGEIGHFTVNVAGRQCGCGNSGCLETEASDNALAWRVSQRLGHTLTIDQVLSLSASGELDASAELEHTLRYLAIGVAAVINLFNPAQLFLHGRMFDIAPSAFDRLLMYTTQRALGPSRRDCTIVRARGCKRQGAVSGIVQHLTNSIAPVLETPALYDGIRPGLAPVSSAVP